MVTVRLIGRWGWVVGLRGGLSHARFVGARQCRSGVALVVLHQTPFGAYAAERRPSGPSARCPSVEAFGVVEAANSVQGRSDALGCGAGGRVARGGGAEECPRGFVGCGKVERFCGLRGGVLAGLRSFLRDGRL